MYTDIRTEVSITINIKAKKDVSPVDIIMLPEKRRAFFLNLSRYRSDTNWNKNEITDMSKYACIIKKLRKKPILMLLCLIMNAHGRNLRKVYAKNERVAKTM
jgi:hypothetical protein